MRTKHSFHLNDIEQKHAEGSVYRTYAPPTLRRHAIKPLNEMFTGQ